MQCPAVPLAIGAPSGTCRSKLVSGPGALMQKASAQRHRESCPPSAVPSHGQFGHFSSRTDTAPLPGVCCRVGWPRVPEEFGGGLGTWQRNHSLKILPRQCIQRRVDGFAGVTWWGDGACGSGGGMGTGWSSSRAVSSRSLCPSALRLPVPTPQGGSCRSRAAAGPRLPHPALAGPAGIALLCCASVPRQWC